MALTYDIIDRDGREISTFGNVLVPVALTGVQTTSGSNLVTVDSTTALFPGMSVALPNIPAGAFIHAVKDSTTIELLRSVFTSGAWSTVAANANASASASSMTGYAYGYHFACIIEQAYAMGMWRNLHSSNVGNGQMTVNVGTEALVHQTYGEGVALVPTAGTWASAVFGATAADIRVSDDLAATPTKRDNGERWGVRPFVLTGGALAHVPARPDWSAVCTAVA